MNRETERKGGVPMMDTHEMAKAALAESKVNRATALADRHDWTREVKALHEISARDAERVSLLESRVALLSELMDHREERWHRRALMLVVVLAAVALLAAWGCLR